MKRNRLALLVVVVALGASLSGCVTRLGKVRADAPPTATTAAGDPCIVEDDEVATGGPRKPEFLVFDPPTMRFSNLYDAPYVWPDNDELITLDAQGVGDDDADDDGVAGPDECPVAMP